MALQTHRSKQAVDMAEQNLRMSTIPTPRLAEANQHGEMLSLHSLPSQLDEAPTLILPAVGIDQFPTYVSLRAIPKPSPMPPSAIDGVSMHDQPTWILPVIPGSVARTVQSRTDQETGRESYVSLIRDLVKNSGIYAIASLTSPLVSLLLSPFLAHTLSRTNYGALVVLNTIVALLTGITQLGLNAAYTRLHTYECQTRREQFEALSTLVILLLLILLPVMLLGEIIAPWLAYVFLGSSSYTEAIQIAMGLVLVQNLTIPSLVWLNAERRPGLFSTVSLINLFVTAGATIVLVGFLHLSITGALIAGGLGDAVIVVCTIPYIFHLTGIHFRLSMASSMLAFGVPHAMNFISGWVLQLSDRYLLVHFASLSLVAGYSAAYSMGSILSAAIIAPFSLAWWVLMYPIAKRDDAQHVFKLVFRWFSIALLFASFAMSLAGISVLHLFFPVSYWATSSIIPIIALSMMFYGIFIVVNLGTSLKRKTWLVSIYFIFSALVNVGANVILIPLFGAMGAALATLIAYITLTLVAYICNQRIYPVPFEVGLFLVALFIGCALYIAGDELAQGQAFVPAAIIHVSVLLLYGLCLLLIGWRVTRAHT